MLSIIFNANDKTKIDMEKKTVFRGNREIFKASVDNLIISNNGTITVLKKNKEVSIIPYKIECDNDLPIWKQLNSPVENYVVQLKGAPNLKGFQVSKIAIQKIIEDKNMLLNI